MARRTARRRKVKEVRRGVRRTLSRKSSAYNPSPKAAERSTGAGFGGNVRIDFIRHERERVGTAPCSAKERLFRIL
jgi:hypothetical protein